MHTHAHTDVRIRRSVRLINIAVNNANPAGRASMRVFWPYRGRCPRNFNIRICDNDKALADAITGTDTNRPTGIGIFLERDHRVSRETRSDVRPSCLRVSSRRVSARNRNRGGDETTFRFSLPRLRSSAEATIRKTGYFYRSARLRERRHPSDDLLLAILLREPGLLSIF